MKIVVAATFDENLADAGGGMYGYVYSGLHYNVFETADEANSFLTNATNNAKSDQIVSIFMIPSVFIVEANSPPGKFELAIDKNITDIDGYVPHNKKLFTSPYNFITVNNMQGTAAMYKYEYFSTTNCIFDIGGDLSCNPNVICYPKNYNNEQLAITEKITMSGYPQCAYTIDAYRAWLAQNGASTGVTTLGSAFALIAGIVSMANPATAPAGIAMAAGGASGVASSMAGIYEHSIQPDQAYGPSGGDALVALGIKYLVFQKTTIRKSFAERIDGYFDMYGYQTNAFKIPNINTRPHWNYVKTKDATITGSMPANDLAQIISNFNNGITFWKNGHEVGDYSLNNEVVTNGQ